jgi:hypothetical protein
MAEAEKNGPPPPCVCERVGGVVTCQLPRARKKQEFHPPARLRARRVVVVVPVLGVFGQWWVRVGTSGRWWFIIFPVDGIGRYATHRLSRATKVMVRRGAVFRGSG